MTTTDEYVPSDEQVRGRYCDGTYVQTGHTTEGEDFDAWLARVRRDAARSALDGLARLAVQIEDGHGRLVPAKRVRDHWAMVEIAARNYRDTHYPEETP